MQNPGLMKSYVDNMSETRGDTVINKREIERAGDRLRKGIMLNIDKMGLTKDEKQIVMNIPINPLVVFANFTSLPHDPHEPAGPPPGAAGAAGAAGAVAETYEGGARKKSRRRTKRRKSKRRKSKKKRTRRRRR